MAFTGLNPTAGIWQRQGLTCLLQAEDLPESAYYGANAVTVRAAAPAAPRAAPRSTTQSTPIFGGSSRPAGPKAGAPTFASAPTSKAVRAESTASHAPPHAPELAPDLASWPAPWQKRLAAARPGLVAWTYWKLGEDVSGALSNAPSAATGATAENACGTTNERTGRRDFFRRLFDDLGHPAGTHTFWPLCLPALSPDEGFTPNAPLFWAGAAALGARGVVVMGSAATKALGLPPSLRPLQQTRVHGLLVWVLWDVDYLLRDAQHYGPMSAFLRQALRPVVRS